MSSDRETTRLVREWLDEGETRLPDRVLDAVLDRVPITRQRRRGAWLSFSAPVIPTALAAAAVVALAFLGLNALGSRDVGGPDPSDGPSPTPDVRATLQFWSGREMPAGEYVIGEPFPARIALTLPDGWTSYGVTDGLAGICSNDCEQPERIALAFWDVVNTFADPCDASGVTDPPIGESVDDLVAALSDLSRHAATEPRAASIGGLDATYLELTADVQLGDCALPGFRAWTSGTDPRESPPGERDRLWILEVGGQRLMVDLAIPDGADPGLVAELESVVDTLRIEPATGH